MLDLGLCQIDDESWDNVIGGGTFRFIREAQGVSLGYGHDCSVEGTLLLLRRLEPLHLLYLFDAHLPHRPIHCVFCLRQVEVLRAYPLQVLYLRVVLRIVCVLDSLGMPDSLVKPSHDVVAYPLHIVIDLRVSMTGHLLLKQSLQFIVKVFEQVLESGLVWLIGAESSLG